MVEQIENLGAELQAHRFPGEREVLVRREIPLPERIAASDIAAGISERVRRIGRNQDVAEIEEVQDVVVGVIHRVARDVHAIVVRTAEILLDAGNLEGCAGDCSVNDGDGLPAEGVVDAADLPATQDEIGHRRHIRRVTQALSERQLIHHAGRIGQRLIVSRERLLRFQITKILRAVEIAVGIFERSRGVVDGLRPCERIQEEQASAEAMLEPYLQAVVVGEAAIPVVSDIAPLRERTRILPLRERQALAGLVGLGLIEVGEQQQAVGPIADVADVEHRVLRDLTLHGEEPAHDVGVLRIARHVGDVRRERIEVRRIGKTGGIALLRGEEPGLAGTLIDDCVHHLRPVDRQQVGCAAAVEVHIAHAESAADHRLRHDLIREADAWSPIAAVRMHQRAVVSAAIFRLKQGGCCRIEIRQVIVLLEMRRPILVAHAEIQGELVVDFEVVLHVREMHVLLQVSDEQGAQSVLGAKAEQKISEVVAAEFAGVTVAPIQRIHIHHLGLDALVFVTDLERMPAHNPRVVDLRVEQRRILPLRIGRLAPEVGVPAGELGRQAAGDARIGREPGNSVQLQRIRQTQRRWVLAGLGARNETRRLASSTKPNSRRWRSADPECAWRCCRILRKARESAACRRCSPSTGRAGGSHSSCR